ncbi:PspC domain-containing protein [Georgenia muralis]|uniref:Phage shock protein C (PspC) family protein n=1 Tax=Georgenia muralis TaxID=154117 RepID=A0A3N4Z6G9_9MICO|nr:PspC domain-containing protein [Georgenia muralis]RPF27594.1 phage shock protein C (PspC) family protein [Georgenia muralis]
MNTNAPRTGPTAGPSPDEGFPSAHRTPPVDPPWAGHQNPPAGAAESSFFTSLRRTGVWRGQDRWIGGVAAGVARRLDIDPLLVRGVLVVLTLFGGLGMLLYGLAWALLPEESDGRIHLQEALRGNVDAALAGALAFVILGLARPGAWWAGWDERGGVFWPLFGLGLLALIVLGVVALARRGSRRPAVGTPGGAAAPPPYAAGGAPAASAYPGTSGVPYPAPGASRPGSPTAWQSTTVGAPGRPGPASPEHPGGRPGPAWGPPPPAATTAYAAASYGQVPPGSSGQVAPAPYRPPAPPVPPRPRTPGPGSGLVAVVIALALLASAGLLLVDRMEPVGWLLPLVLGGIVLALLGLGALLAGVTGRRGGALSILGVLLALLVVPATLAVSASPVALNLESSATFGDLDAAPVSVDEARQGYDLGAGDLRLDLTGLDLSGADPTDATVTVPVNVGAGDVTVVLPEASATVVRVDVGAGNLASITGPGWTDDDGVSPFAESADESERRRTTWASGVNISHELISPAAGEDGADLVVVITAGASDILIEEQR